MTDKPLPFTIVKPTTQSNQSQRFPDPSEVNLENLENEDFHKMFDFVVESGSKEKRAALRGTIATYAFVIERGLEVEP